MFGDMYIGEGYSVGGGDIANFTGDFYITEINSFKVVYKMGGGFIINISNMAVPLGGNYYGEGRGYFRWCLITNKIKRFGKDD